MEDTPAPSGQFLDALFETHKSLVRPTDLGARKGKTEEGDLVGMSHLAFLLVDFEFESLFKKPGDTGHDPLTRPATFHQDDEVIGIAGEAVASPLKFLVQLIQEDVAEQWRKWTTLRYTLTGFMQAVTYHHSCSQVCADQLQDALVAYLSTNPGHEHIVLHRVKKFRQVGIDSHAVSLADVMTDLVHGIVGRQPLTETKTCLRKTGSKIGTST